MIDNVNEMLIAAQMLGVQSACISMADGECVDVCLQREIRDRIYDDVYEIDDVEWS